MSKAIDLLTDREQQKHGKYHTVHLSSGTQELTTSELRAMITGMDQDREVRRAIANAMVEELEQDHSDYGAVQAYGVALARLTAGDVESVTELEDGIQNWIEPVLDREVER